MKEVPFFDTKHRHNKRSVLKLLQEHGPLQFKTLSPSKNQRTTVRLSARKAIDKLVKEKLVRQVYIGRDPYYVTTEWIEAPENRLQHIYEQTRHSVCGCHIWEGYVEKRRGPISRFDGAARSVRRILWEHSKGTKLDPNQIIKVTCEEERCVNLQHFKLEPRSSGKGTTRTLLTRMRLSAAMSKRRGKLTIEDVKAIRESTETPKELAARFGVTAGNISLILKHRTYKDYSSPYTGLFTGLQASNNDSKRRAA